MHRTLVSLVLLAALATRAQAIDLAGLRALDGAVADGQYGFSVAVVGDMDGDGYAEYAVGASSDSTGGPGAGRVFIYRGGPQHLADPPAWVITGLPGDLLGMSLAAVGDVDGDGYADLLIGAPAGTTVDPSLPGRALLAFGGRPLGTRAPLVITGPVPGGRFGAALAGLGDWSGDGAPDFAIGAPQANAQAGLVAIFLGGPGVGLAPWATLHGRAAGDQFGSAVAGAGRTRGGATGDLLVGAPFRSTNTVWEGEADLFLGGAGADTVPDRTYTGAAAGDFLGTALAGVGDVDADGHDDFVIGAPGANVGALVDAGRAYLYAGAATPPTTPLLTVAGSAAYTELGLAVAGVGDVNADGFADWAVGAPGGPDANSAGAVQLFLGRATPLAAPDTTLAGAVVGDMFGRAISNGGRVEAGAHALFLVGANAHGIGGGADLYGAASATVAVAELGTRGLVLDAPRPNPVTLHGRLTFSLVGTGRVQLALFDPRGRFVRELFAGTLGAGPHAIPLDTSGLAPGIYLARLAEGGASVTRKLLVAP